MYGAIPDGGSSHISNRIATRIGPVAELRRKYEIVFRFPEIVGLFIGTRPDELPEPVLSLLQETGRRIYLSVELGLQSIHERSLGLLNRNHTGRAVRIRLS